MKDSVLARLNSIALLRYLTDNTASFWSSANLVFSSCAQATQPRFPHLFNSVFDSILPLGDLKLLYINLWENDIVNKINVKATALEKLQQLDAAYPNQQLLSSINPSVLQQLKDNSPQPIVIPYMDTRRSFDLS